MESHVQAAKALSQSLQVFFLLYLCPECFNLVFLLTILWFTFSSGSRSGHIHHHDVRVADHHIFTLSGHSQEVCGLEWSPDGRYLASGGNDNLVYVWPGVQEGSGQGSNAVHGFNEHQGAVKVSKNV